MAKKYDVIVVGAGPSGFLAAKAAGENGLEVALLERKPDITQLTRACGQTLVSMNEYYLGDLVGYNARNKRIFFPVNGFSFKYDGPYKNIYGMYMYTPNGHKIEIGDLKEQRKKEDYGRIGLVFDKEVLFRCLLKEVKDCSVDVFPGINVENVTATAEGVRVEGSGQSFEGAYLIAADGCNSSVAHVMGFNNDRNYYCNIRFTSYYMSGMEPPESNIVIYMHVFLKEGGATCYILPQATNGMFNVIVLSVNPRIDLEAARNYLMKEAFCASWFKNAKILRTFSANEDCYTPIVEPFKDRVLVAGDVGSTQELEITGAMISGWKAGQAVSTAIQEGNLGLEITGFSQYSEWWKKAYINYYDWEAYIKGYATSYILTTAEDINYVFGLIKETLPASWHPYTLADHIGQALRKVAPIIQQEKPEVFQKLQRKSLPASQIFAEIT